MYNAQEQSSIIKIVCRDKRSCDFVVNHYNNSINSIDVVENEEEYIVYLYVHVTQTEFIHYNENINQKCYFKINYLRKLFDFSYISLKIYKQHPHNDNEWIYYASTIDLRSINNRKKY